MEPGVVARTAERLRRKRAELVAAYGYAGLHNRVRHAVEDAAAWWQNPDFSVRCEAARDPGEFSFDMVEVSLAGLLSSLSAKSLERLVISEEPDLTKAPALIGHIIAGNTPLLSWTSVIRALLVGSASLVKAPTSPQSCWIDYLIRTLQIAAPELADLVDTVSWRGGDSRLDGALCDSVDRVVVYGADSTIDAVRRLAPGKTLGYGHRLSAGFVLAGCDEAAAADGLASDVLVYDQSGCLSPHTVFVEGGFPEAIAFGSRLSAAFGSSRFSRSMPPHSAARAAAVREYRELCRFSAVQQMWEGDSLRWTVIASPERRFRATPTYSIVHVAPFDAADASSALDVVRGKLQGAAIAAGPGGAPAELSVQIKQFGVSYICAPGELQAPPLNWRENGLPVLQSLIS